MCARALFCEDKLGETAMTAIKHYLAIALLALVAPGRAAAGDAMASRDLHW